jgi:hypothetical protein
MRMASLAASVALYVSCLPFYSFCVARSCTDWPSWSVLVFGWLGLFLGGSLANVVWFANPILFFAWIAILIGGRTAATYASGFALLLAAGFPAMKTVVTNEAGILVPITGVKLGYWLWLGSICVGVIASVMRSQAPSGIIEIPRR